MIFSKNGIGYYKGEMMEEHKDYIDRMIGQQQDDLGELCRCFDGMMKQRLYKEMLPILRMIEETAPDVYQAYYRKAENAYEHQKKQERMMQ